MPHHALPELLLEGRLGDLNHASLVNPALVLDSAVNLGRTVSLIEVFVVSAKVFHDDAAEAHTMLTATTIMPELLSTRWITIA